MVVIIIYILNLFLIKFHLLILINFICFEYIFCISKITIVKRQLLQFPWSFPWPVTTPSASCSTRVAGMALVSPCLGSFLLKYIFLFEVSEKWILKLSITLFLLSCDQLTWPFIGYKRRILIFVHGLCGSCSFQNSSFDPLILSASIVIFLRKVLWKWEFSKRCLWEIAKWNYFDLIFFILKIQYIVRKVKLILFFLVHWLNQKVLGVVNNNISKLSSFHLFVLIWLWSPSTLNPIASIWRLNSSRVRSFNT